MAGIVTIEGQRKVKKRGSVTLLPDPPTPDVWFPFVSVDDHLLEPPDIFEERVPRAMKDKAPHVTYNFNGESGVPAWRIDDEDHPIAAVNGAVGRPISEWNGAASMFTDFRPGVTDPHQRLLDMDKVGGWASLCFPSITWGFGGRRFAQPPGVQRLDDRRVGCCRPRSADPITVAVAARRGRICEGDISQR